MERKYPTDELLITRPWVVVSDESATKKLTPIDMLELRQSLIPLGQTPRGMSKKMIERVKQSEKCIHTVVLRQKKLFTMVVPASSLGFVDVLTGKKYFDLSFVHNCPGDTVVLDDEKSGVDKSLVPLIELIGSNNADVIAYLLATKPELSLEEMIRYLKIYNKKNEEIRPKTLILTNELINPYNLYGKTRICKITREIK